MIETNDNCYSQYSKEKLLEIIKEKDKNIDFLTDKIDKIENSNKDKINIEEKFLNQVLNESEEKFKNISDQALMGIIIIQDFRMVYLNDAALDNIKYSREEAQSWTFKEFISIIHSEDREVVKNLVKNNTNTYFTLRMKDKNGHTIWIEQQSKIINYRGKSALLILFRDVTERKEALEKLEASEEKFRAVIEQSTEGIIMVNLEGKIIEWNKGCENIVQIKQEEVIGKNVWDLPIFSREFNEHSPEIIKSFKDNIPQLSNKMNIPMFGKPTGYPIKLRDGSTKYITNSVFYVKTQYEHLICGILQDVTEIRNAELMLREREKKLEKSLKEKEILLKEIHHRVKNNLQIISAITLMQEQNANDVKTKERFREYQSRIGAMAKIHEMIHYTNQFDNINAIDYINNLVRNLFQTYQVKSEQISLNIDAEEIGIDFDHAMHYGLIINELISNSLKHAFPNNRQGVIFIKLFRNREKSVILEVNDDGIGIPKDIKFLDSNTMGLKIVNTSVNQLNGKLDLIEGNGTHWKIIFKNG